MLIQFIILLFIAILAVIIWKWKPARKSVTLGISQNDIEKLLSENVLYYQRLSETEKLGFEKKISGFLQQVRIEGVGLTVDDTDKVLVAASAIIPTFAFPFFEYPNLKQVLIYPNSFDRNFQTSTSSLR